jgi:hypothetical protein
MDFVYSQTFGGFFPPTHRAVLTLLMNKFCCGLERSEAFLLLGETDVVVFKCKKGL